MTEIPDPARAASEAVEEWAKTAPPLSPGPYADLAWLLDAGLEVRIGRDGPGMTVALFDGGRLAGDPVTAWPDAVAGALLAWAREVAAREGYAPGEARGPGLTAPPHAYVSTACVHGECGACRNTCKYCDASCAHPCHPATAGGLPEPWVDQARDIARELLRYGLGKNEAVPPGLLRRIGSDPALFWLRGEAVPPGEWRDPETAEDPAC